MSLGRLADRLLQRIVPTVEAGACSYEWCGCYPFGAARLCRNAYTDCNGNCTRWGQYCGVGVNC